MTTDKIDFISFWTSAQGLEYRAFAPKTAIYPKAVIGDQDASWVYLVFGLIEESGELYEASIAGDVSRVQAEAGDCFWYMAQLLNALNLRTDEVLPDVSPARLAFASLAKRMIRDAKGDCMHEALRRDMLCCLRDLFDLICDLVRGQEPCDHDALIARLFAVLRANEKKLLDRQARGTLGGSGDNR
jgi:hypothetical protein